MPQVFNVGAPSRFVTAIAWIVMLAVAAFVCAVLLGSAGVLSILSPGDAHGPAPAVEAGWQRWSVGAALLPSLAAAVAAGGLLRRLEWARRLFIAAGLLALAAHLPGLWTHYETLRTLVGTGLHRLAPQPPEWLALLGGALVDAHGLALLLGGLVALAVQQVLQRLMSPAIRQEFS